MDGIWERISDRMQEEAAQGAPLYRQLYGEIREGILTGNLAAGVRLPSSRALAAGLGVSRNTVLEALEQLGAEGYLRGRAGSGTFVEALSTSRPQPPHSSRPAASGAGIGLSRRGRRIAQSRLGTRRIPDQPRAFRPGLPALDRIPYRELARISAAVYRRLPPELGGYQNPEGYGPLREQIAHYLNVSRNVPCSADQVIVVNGSQEALLLAGLLLLEPGGDVFVEDPGYPGARAAFEAAGGRLRPIPVDAQGLSVATLRRRIVRRALIHVTPSHQFPLGMAMPVARRGELLEIARRTDSWIFEDDYDSEFRYASRPLTSLAGLDRTERVLYSGTFSKVLYPGLRLGYLVVPERLIDSFRAARATVARHSAALDQVVLARFMEGGGFYRHIRRMRNLYRERQAFLLAAAERTLGHALCLEPCDSGMHVVGRFPEPTDDVAVSERALMDGVQVPALSAYSTARNPERGLLLGFSGFDERQMSAALRRMKSSLC